jgi:hypothetical protein
MSIDASFPDIARGGRFASAPLALKGSIVVQLLSFSEYPQLREVPACALQAGRSLFGFERPAL